MKLEKNYAMDIQAQKEKKNVLTRMHILASVFCSVYLTWCTNRNQESRKEALAGGMR